MTRPVPAFPIDPPAENPAPQTPEETNPGAVDSVLGWMGLYVPSWGSSLLLHVAVAVLAVFMAANMSEAVVPLTQVKGTVALKANIPVQHARKPEPVETRGKLKMQVSQFSWRNNNMKLPGIGDTPKATQADVFGINGSGPGGGLEGLGTRNIGGGDVLFDYPEPRKIVYVVDRSGSMTDPLEIVKLELKRSLSELPDDKEFHVVFYSSGPALENSPRRLVSATERNKQQAYEFIDGVVAQGETDPSEAIKKAFDCKPELIYLLTDGEFDRDIINLVKRLNPGGKVVVHTIGFLYKGGEEVLKQIANDNSGLYKFVSEKDLATIIRGY
jgi:hypothetical protein